MIVGTVARSMLLVGAALAGAAERCSAPASAVELSAGLLIVGGLALLGAGRDCALDPDPVRIAWP